MAVLEAQIVALTRQDAELLLQILEQSHSEINWEEEHNSGDHHDDIFY
jgi:hypothetical protein